MASSTHVFGSPSLRQAFQPASSSRAFSQRLLGNQAAAIGLAIVGIYVFLAIAADWLTSAWDQNAGIALPTPAASVIEEVVGRWLGADSGVTGLCIAVLGGAFTDGNAVFAPHVRADGGVHVEPTHAYRFERDDAAQ